MQAHSGKSLSRHLQRRADDYARQILGGKEYAPWLYVYSLVSDGFKEGWIPDNFFGWFVRPKNLGHIAKFKTLSKAILRTSALPDVGYHIEGVFYTRDLKPADAVHVRGALGAHTTAFVKKDASDQGTGIIKLAVSDIDEENFRQIGNCVIQSPVQQHEFFARIIPGPVATIRITTARTPAGTIEMAASYLRLARSGTDWVQSAHAVRIAVMTRSGELDSFAYTADWRRWERHPDTNVVFAKQRIPCFSEAVDLCTNLHRSLPHFALIGWDVTIDADDEVKLLEWNAGHTDIKFSEATTGPCFLGLEWEKLGPRGQDVPRRAGADIAP